MEKVDLLLFASVVIISGFYIYFFDEKNKPCRKKKKIDKEIEEAVKNLNYGKFTKKQFVGFEK